MEFQFGTNWARFSQLSGGIIGQHLAMEGVFSFFLESAFLGLSFTAKNESRGQCIGSRRSWFLRAHGRKFVKVGVIAGVVSCIAIIFPTGDLHGKYVAHWLIYGLMRTSEGFSSTVSVGHGLFTLIGFMGLYALLGLLFTVLVYREINRGPEPEVAVAVHAG